MYTIVPMKKSSKCAEHDYIFKDFESFYKLASAVTIPLEGRYSVGIMSDNVEEITKFIKQNEIYEWLNVTLYVAESIVDYMSQYDTKLRVKDVVKDWDVYIESVKRHNILFAKNVVYTLYASIGHKAVEIEEALDQIVEEYGAFTEITEKMLEKLFILNKVVYPRTVLLEYLNMGRYRRNKLQRCLDAVGNDVTLGAIIKNIKLIYDEKVNYYTTGKCSSYVKYVDTNNLMQMYRVFIADRNRLNDVCILLDMYERGISSYDFSERNR